MAKLLLFLTLFSICTGYCYAHSQVAWTAQQAILNAANMVNGLHEGNNKPSHSINRRQVANQQRCTTAVLNYQCTSDYGPQLVNISANCGNNKQARGFAGACARNENGQYCPIAGMNLPSNEPDCSRFSCSSACRSYLQSLRSILGCCINSLFNFTDSPAVVREAFSYSLWSACGVDTVGSCDNGLDFTPTLNNKVCTDDDLHQRLAQAECSPPHSEQIESALTNAGGCDQFLRLERDVCTLNSQGELCAGESRDDLISFAESGTASVIPVINNCRSASRNFCPSSCRSALQTFRNDLGCCANNIYNNPNTGTTPVIPSELWDACDVDDPGRCGAMTISAALSGLTISVAVVILNIFVM